MSEHVYKHIELTGSSKTSLEEAIQNAVNKAAQSVRNMRWFVVTEQRGYIETMLWHITRLQLKLDLL